MWPYQTPKELEKPVVPETIGERLYLARRYRGLTIFNVRHLLLEQKSSITIPIIRIFEANQVHEQLNEYIDWMRDWLCVSEEWIRFGTGKISVIEDDIDPFQIAGYNFKKTSGRHHLRSRYGYHLSDDELVDKAIAEVIIENGTKWDVEYKRKNFQYNPSFRNLSYNSGEWNRRQLRSIVKEGILSRAWDSFSLPRQASLGELLEKCLDTTIIMSKDNYKDYPGLCKDIELLILHVYPPSFERATGNTNKNTFDFIRIEASLPSKNKYSQAELKQKVSENMDEIMDYLMEKLASNRQFQKYNIPIGFLRITRCTITASRILEVVFELKHIDGLSNAE